VSGRVVIVTGASSGIGEATARAFSRAGDRVVLTARRADRLQRIARDLPESLVVPADLSRPEELGRIVEETLRQYGQIDVLVNNAGIGVHEWFDRSSEETIRLQVEVNLLAPILLTRAVIPAMVARRRGTIINVASVAGRIATPTLAIYSAAKFGLDGFSEALRRELRPLGIHVCVLYPGVVQGTEFGRDKRVDLNLTSPPWLSLTPERVAREIVRLADRPRPRRVLPGTYWLAVALNTFLPSLVDRAMWRVVQKARVGP